MDDDKNIRKPAVAGYFYPREPKKLADDIDRLMARTGPAEAPGRIRVAVAPHAGYQYSGQVAAYSYRVIREQQFHTAVVVSPSHMERFDFSAVFDGLGYETPLGVVETAEDVAKRLAVAGGSVKYSSRGHVQSHLTRQEHALEVQIPFLQRACDACALVPVVMGSQEWDLCLDLGRALASVLTDPGVVVITSTDLSHFHSGRTAEKLDGSFCDLLTGLDAKKLYEAVTDGGCEACGAGPVVAGLIATEALPGRTCKILKYANSGDVTGDYESVVGYLSAVITAPV